MAGQALKRLDTLSPTFRANAGDFLDRAFFAPEVRQDLLDVIARVRGEARG
jgi:hypothetical protein